MNPKLFKNVSFMLASNFGRLPISFFVNAWLARYFGAEKQGVWALGLTVITLLAPLTWFGPGEMFMRDLSQNTQSKVKVVANFMAIRVAFSIVAFAIALIYLGIQNASGVFIPLAVLAAVLLVREPGTLWAQWFAAKVDSVTYLKGEFVLFSLLQSTFLLLVFLKMPFIAFCAAYFIQNFGVFLWGMFLYRRREGDFSRWRFDKEFIFSVIKQARPLVLAFVATACFQRIDRLMLQRLGNFSDLGVYSVAGIICDVLASVPAIIMMATAPSIVYAEKDEIKLKIRIQKAQSVLLWVGLALALGVTAFGGSLLEISFGSKFADSAKILRILVWGNIFLFTDVPIVAYLISINKLSILLFKSLAGLAVASILCWLLIPKYGGSGAAYSMIAGLFVSTCVSYSFSPSTREFLWWQIRALNPMLCLKTCLEIASHRSNHSARQP